MRISEEGLRRRIGSDKLIGCYTQKDNGYTCFMDIRGEEGDMVKNPHTSQYDLEIEYNDSNLDYEPSALYEVKKDDHAVDIQINDEFR